MRVRLALNPPLVGHLLPAGEGKVRHPQPTAGTPDLSQGKGGRILDRSRADSMVEESITVDRMLAPSHCALQIAQSAHFLVRLSGISLSSETLDPSWACAADRAKFDTLHERNTQTGHILSIGFDRRRAAEGRPRWPVQQGTRDVSATVRREAGPSYHLQCRLVRHSGSGRCMRGRRPRRSPGARD